MKVHIEPTSEMFDVLLMGGVKVPTRIWSGITDLGTPVELYVLSIVPTNDLDTDELKAQLPDYMMRTSVVFNIDK